MHISLDSALGRQRRLNSVGESVFQIAPNASAGYSLRSLTGGDPAVVRVRRASDNSEKDFNSSGVSSGELVNWVNGQVVPPLDVRELVDGERTGALIPAAAAYSLRNLSASGTSFTTVGDTQTDYFSFTGATGDTAALNGTQYEYGFPYNGAKGYDSAPPAPEDSQMIRDNNGRWLLFRASSNPQGPKTYALSAIGSTEYPWEADWTGTDLENAVFTQQRTGDYVVQVRRSSDSTIRSFTAAEVADGTLEAWVLAPVSSFIGNKMWLDGVDDYVSVNVGSTSLNGLGAVTISAYAAFNKTNAFEVLWSFGSSAYRVYLDRDGSGNIELMASTDTGFTPATNQIYFFEVDYNSSGEATEFRVDGNVEWTGTAAPVPNAHDGSNVFLVGARNSSGTAGLFMTGLVYNVTISGTLNWIGNGNTDAAWVDQIGSNNGTVNGSPELFTGQGCDGFVTKWYDQSGNDNHAVQTTPANQPTIVEGGSLVSGGLDFDGVDDYLEQTLTLAQPITIFSAYKALSNSSFVTGSASSSLSFGRRFNGEYSMFSGATIGAGTHPSTEVLASCVFNGASATGHWNGVNILSGDAGTRTDFDYVGRNSSNYLDGTIQELIIYTFDQSANRVAIETNINAHYDIYP